MLTVALAGCYQQAPDNFEPVSSSGQGQPPAPTATVLLIDPNAGQDPTPTQDMVVPPTATDDAPLFMPTATDMPSPVPTASQPEATPTVLVIVPQLPTNTPFPTPEVLVATSTPIAIITPQAPMQLVLPSATPTLASADAQTSVNTSGIVTPTALPEFVPPECVYVVRSGDNLFRIALNNNVSLADLLAINGLSERSIIQPNQELRLPNCQPDTASAAATLAATTSGTSTTGGASAPVPLAGTPDNTGTSAVASQAVHRVAAGETLFAIARRYGVTIQAIVNANQLANPDRLSVGQELIIPTR